jgi:HSP20 family molecular chaperone IbpA
MLELRRRSTISYNEPIGIDPGRLGGGRNRLRTHGSLVEGPLAMSKLHALSSPLLLGFDEIERLLDRVGKSGAEGYPPYNIERLPQSDGTVERLRITIAVAGFARSDLEITVEDRQLMVRGKQQDDQKRTYLYRGIAARQFQRTFVLADGIEVRDADLTNGLLAIDLVRHEPNRLVRRIEIGTSGS